MWIQARQLFQEVLANGASSSPEQAVQKLNRFMLPSGEELQGRAA